MVQKILGFSGRKQSGKNTCANVIFGWEMISLGITRNFSISECGQLVISDIFGDDSKEGILDIMSSRQPVREFLSEHLDYFVKLYSFADLLKKNVCMDILGLTREQCYGTDEEKNSNTHIEWGIMPFENSRDKSDKVTARELMQYVGTDFFRKMYPNVWADATIRKIKEDSSHMAIVTDCRFPNEVEAIKNAGGKVIRLSRNSQNKDVHSSEVALDKDNYDWSNFDSIIQNESIPVGEQNKILYDLLKEWGWLELSISQGLEQ